MKTKNGKFWMLDEFIDEHAKKLTPYEQIVYVALCRHANSYGETFVGARRMADELNINKNTVSKSIKKLEAYSLVIRLKGGAGKLSTLKITSVSFKDTQLSRPVIHKEDVKEEKKEALPARRERTPEEQTRIDQRLSEIKSILIEKFIIKPKL